MRGIHVVRADNTVNTGIIPAHAGHTSLCPDLWFSRRDHPRTCGAYGVASLALRFSLGSSPHMRGIRIHVSATILCAGIIPAHAGHTICLCFCGRHGRDHPRTCGAYKCLNARPKPMTGSSPHMRGILAVLSADDDEHGIIPAHAGHTSA